MRFTLEPPSPAPQEKPVALRLSTASMPNDGAVVLEAWTGANWSALLWLDSDGKVYRHMLYDRDTALGFRAAADGRIEIGNPDRWK